MERLNTLMDQKELDLIRRIEQTRAAMGKKIDMLAEQLYDTFIGPKVAVEHLLENLQQAKQGMEATTVVAGNGAEPLHPVVGETIERVQTIFHLQEQTRRDPWQMLGSALVMGYVIGCLNPRAMLRGILIRHSGHAEPRNPPLQTGASSPVCS
jgi:hypothetical protein